MSILDLFRKSKKAEQRDVAVQNAVHQKKNKYTADMLRLQKQTQLIHKQSLKSLQAAKELNSIVNDIASRIAIATGGTDRGL